ncbi:carnitine O-palmitoyltransferase 1, liver isoform-like [Dysidea avara]|uniref:carnitine O-palmitoyltransferase 1, liver isoform-like n=1 Tax=Dysidea avara TaxID=196820 RepID=UPI0033308BFB
MVVTIISLLMTGVAGATLAVTFSLWGVLKDDVLANQFPIVGPGWSLWMTWAAIGFVCGAVIWYGLLFLRVRIIRLLLSYDHWFIRKPNCFDWLWALCLKMLMDSKNLGFRGYQDILPTLPIPSLQATCKRFLETVEPLLSGEEYSEAEKSVKEFLNGKGPYIHRMLYLQAWRSRNWCSDLWLEYIYLRGRSSLLINSNYYALDYVDVATPHQLDRAAMRTYCTLKIIKDEREGKLPNMLAKDLVPFCGHYFKYSFGSARIPCKSCDELRPHPHSRHIVVIRKGQFFKVTVFDNKGNLMPPSQLKRIIKKVMDTIGDEEDNNFIAALTAQDRDVWAQQREILIQNSTNLITLNALESALLVFSLDDRKPETLLERANDTFVGNGSNRWLDKGLSIVYYSNGRVGINVEHTALDATIIAQLSEYASYYEDYNEDGHIIDDGASDIDVESPAKLYWCFDNCEHFLTAARKNYETMVAGSDLACDAMDYGKRIPKLAKLSPDGWFQMAIQLAYYRIYKKHVQTYESATTRMFYKGRTETIRPVSEFSCQFTRLFDDPSAKPDDKKSALKKAIRYQEQYKLEAMRGLGIDRHLFGLYLIAKGINIKPFPKLFEHKSFTLPFELSTSQTPTKLTKYYKLERCGQLGGFGTITETGYGISYIVCGEDNVNFSVHSKKSCPSTDSTHMLEQIREAMNDMRKLYNL